jgi:ACS family tartrate transporter-like MFS transporter
LFNGPRRIGVEPEGLMSEEGETRAVVAQHGHDHSVSERAIVRQVFLRLIPFLFLLYVVNILDRVNVGFAKLRMQDALELSDRAFGLGAGIFYLGYVLFEVPSNFILTRVGARRWIGRIMISWGIVSACTMFVRGASSFYVIRFLLGVAEAGFFPGIILYLSHWFPARDRARAVAWFMVAAPVASIVGNPLSGALLEFTDGAAGLSGWQWLFLVEGLPSIVLGIVVWLALTDSPDDAAWLSVDAKRVLAARLREEASLRERQHGLSRLRAVMHPQVRWLILVYFTAAVGTNASGFFAPSILKDPFGDLNAFGLGLLSVLPHMAAAAAMVLISRHSDRTGERRWHVAGAAVLASIGWAVAATAPSRWLTLLGLTLAQAGMMSMLAPFWALSTSLLSGTAAVGGIALINSVANLGGFLAPIVMGQIKDATRSFTGGMAVLAAIMLCGAVLVLKVRHQPEPQQATHHASRAGVTSRGT